MTLRISTSAQTAANFIESYHARSERKEAGRPWQPPNPTTTNEAAALRELVLAKVGRLTPKWPMKLHEDVEIEWGRVDLRRISRVVKWLLDRGDIVRTPDGYVLAPRRRQA